MRLACRSAMFGLLVPLVLLGLVVGLPVEPSGAATGDTATVDEDPIDDAAIAEEYLSRINELRAEVGAGQLEVLPQLTLSARRWTEEMIAAQRLSHDPDPVDELTVYWDMFAENVGTGHNVDTLWPAFLESAKHRANIVNPAYTHVGVAVITEENGRQWTTHRFLRKLDAPVQTLPPGSDPPVFFPDISIVTTPPTLPPVSVAPTVPPVTMPPVTVPPPPTVPPTAAPTTAPPTTVPSPLPAVETSADPHRVSALLDALQHLP